MTIEQIWEKTELICEGFSANTGLGYLLGLFEAGAINEFQMKEVHKHVILKYKEEEEC